MPIGLVGRKVGMTRVFTDDGVTQPVTVLDVSDNRVTQIKSAEKDGYASIQVASASAAPAESANPSPGISPRRVSKPATRCANSAPGPRTSPT